MSDGECFTRTAQTTMPNKKQLPPGVQKGKMVQSKPLMPKNPRKGQKATRNQKRLLMRTKPSANDIQTYRMALFNPFLPEAYGARVPDSFSRPTACYHFRGIHSLSSDPNGNLEFMLMPNPFFCLLMGVGSVVTPATSFTNNTKAYYLQSANAAQAILSSYRVVAWGIKIVAKDTAYAEKGRLVVATVPTTENSPSYNTLLTVTASDASIISLYATGNTLSTTSPLVTNPVDVPGAQVLSAQDLLQRQYLMAVAPSHVDQYLFHGLVDRNSYSWASNTLLSDEGVFNSVSGILVNSTSGGRKDVASLRGGTAVWIQATGLPASSNEFDIDFIYHLECIPNTYSNVLIPSSMTTLAGTTNIVETVIAETRPVLDRLRGIAAEGATKAVKFVGKQAIAAATAAFL